MKQSQPAGDENSAAAANTRQEADPPKQAHQEQAALLRAEAPLHQGCGERGCSGKGTGLPLLVFWCSTAQCSGAGQLSILLSERDSWHNARPSIAEIV